MRVSWSFVLCLVFGALLLAVGWLIPAHLRAVDIGVIRDAGRGTMALTNLGMSLATSDNLGAAYMLAQAAEQEQVPSRSALVVDVNLAMARHPVWLPLGAPAPRLQSIFDIGPARTNASVPFTDLVLRLGNLDRAMAYLSAAQEPSVRQILLCRELTNTAIFPPSRSPAGQAFDAALAVCGLLMEEGKISPGMSNAISTLAGNALGGGGSERFEQVLLDYMSLGQRLNWNQLEFFTSHIEDANTLRLLANAVRGANGREPVVFSAVVLSDRPAAVANYLVDYSQTGLGDLGRSLVSGSGAVRELVRLNRRMEDSPLRANLRLYEPVATFLATATDYSWRMPAFTLIVRWLLYLAAGYLLALALHLAMPEKPDLERPLEVRGMHVARGLLFALGFLLVVLVLSEPFLAQNSQKAAFPFRLRMPGAGGAVPAGLTGAPVTFMNPANLLTMLLFFVLQALLYSACLLKLAEIRRQRVQARVRLKLLENEDHLFDAGLYLGFLGTIVSFILFSLNFMQHFSLMVAYSSTSFGIVFVSIFKIFNLRPLRRQLLMEAEVESGGIVAQDPAATLAPTL